MNRQLYDLVIHRDGRLIEAGLTIEDARAKARDWNSRASLETWVTWEPARQHEEALHQESEARA